MYIYRDISNTCIEVSYIVRCNLYMMYLLKGHHGKVWMYDFWRFENQRLKAGDSCSLGGRILIALAGLLEHWHLRSPSDLRQVMPTFFPWEYVAMYPWVDGVHFLYSTIEPIFSVQPSWPTPFLCCSWSQHQWLQRPLLCQESQPPLGYIGRLWSCNGDPFF